MKQIIKLFGLLLFLTSNFAYAQEVKVNCPPDTIVNVCDSSIVTYDTLSTENFTTIDSISYLFTFEGIDTDSGSGTGTGEWFYTDSTNVTISVWDTVGTDTIRTCSFYVIVKDTSPPNITATDTTVYMDSTGGVKVDTSYFGLSITDNCSGVDSVWLTQDTFNCQLDTVVVWVNALDSAGNLDSISANLIILDTIAPSISSDSAMAYLDSLGGIKIDTSYFTLDIWDNCTVDSVWLSNDTFSCADPDTTQLWIYVSDLSNNKDSVQTEIVLYDTIAPLITVADTAVVYLDSQGVASFDTSYFGIITNDACGIDSIWLSQDTIACPGDTLNQGWAFAMDVNGNKDSVKAYVLVRDTIAPSMICMLDTLYLDNNGQAILLPDSVDAGSFDNCGIDSMGLSKWDFSCSDVGLDSTILYGWDKWGLLDSCQAYVLVQDTTPPVVMCKDTTVYLDQNGQVSIDTSFVLSSMWDNCSIDTLIISDTLFTCTDTGANSVFLYISDPSGNLDTCEAIVTVKDTIKPTITCPYNIIVQADKNKCDTLLNITAPVISDNCINPQISYTLTGATTDAGVGNISDTFNTGITLINWLVTDIDGNVAGCAQSVTTFTSLVAINDTTGTHEDTNLSFYPLNNDLDCDDDIDPSTLIVIDSTNHGTIEVDDFNGKIIYKPNENYNGKDTLQYKVWDDNGFVDSATVYISISPVNDAPVLSNEVITTKEDSVYTGTVITNADTDIEGDTLTVSSTLYKEASNGLFVVVADGSFTYTPSENFFGLDTVIVTVCDSGLPANQCGLDTVFITVTQVNDAPIITNEYLIIDEDNVGTGDLTNDDDYDPDGTDLTVSTWVLRPTNGTMDISAQGLYTYIPSPNYNGYDTVVVSVCDGDLPVSSCTNDTLFITVEAVNDPPVLVNEYITIDEDSDGISGDMVNVEDSDPEGTNLTASTTLVVAPAHGIFTVAANGSYTYVPVKDYNGSDMVVVSVCDEGIPGIACANDTLFITITPVNDAPKLAQNIPDVVMDLYNTEIIDIENIFSDPDVGDVLTYSGTLLDLSVLPDWISFDAATGKILIIDPDDKENLGDTYVIITATDNDGASISDVFKITVKQIYTISGKVITNTGTPPTKSVKLTEQETGDPAPNVRMILKEGTTNIDTVITNTNGEYIFEGLTPGTYEVLVDVQFFTQDTTVILELTEAEPEATEINFTIWVNGGVITDVDDLISEFEVNLYPNPSKGMVNLRVENDQFSPVEINVFNESGRKVFQREYQPGQLIKFDISQNSSGLYFVKIKSENKEIIKKLILNKR